MLEENLRLSSISPLHIFSPPPLVPAPFCPPPAQKKRFILPSPGIFITTAGYNIGLNSTQHSTSQQQPTIYWTQQTQQDILLSINSTRTGTVILFPKGIINFDGWMNFVVILGGAS
jgi:hypothetical protein